MTPEDVTWNPPTTQPKRTKMLIWQQVNLRMRGLACQRGVRPPLVPTVMIGPAPTPGQGAPHHAFQRLRLIAHGVSNSAF
jgi:hypothetical protein